MVATTLQESAGWHILSENRPEPLIQVFLLLQNRLLREALNRLLRKRAGFVVLGCGAQENCSFQSLLNSNCDVAILDFLDAELLRADLGAHQKTSSPIKFLLISMTDDVGKFFAAIKGGIAGYLLNDASLSEVISAVYAVHRGEAVCPPKLCAELFRKVSTQLCESGCTSTQSPAITLRQQFIVTLVAKGLTNKEIASYLNLSEFTVRNHLHRIMGRVGAENRNEMVERVLPTTTKS